MPVLTEEVLSRYSKAKKREFKTAAVGVTFRDPAHIDAVNTGDFGLLSPELDNEYDQHAVAIIHNETGNKVGYIKRELNKEIWENIVNNGDLYLIKFTRTGGPEEGKANTGLNLHVIRMYNDE